MKKNILVISGIIGVFVLTTFLFKLPVGISYEGMWLYLAILVFIPGFVLNNMKMIFGGIGFALFIFIAKTLTSPIFMSSSYVDLVEVKDTNISQFNTKEDTVRRVTIAMALQKANKILGKKINGVQLSSQYQIETSMASVMDINGKLKIILPLDYRSFVKWMNLDYIPGYIEVDATDPKAKPVLVSDKKITISENGLWSDNIDRQVWLKSGLSQTKTHMEIDDNGNVFYITAVIKPELGFNADGVTSIIVTNAETKEMFKGSLKEVVTKYPWIDRVWPEYIVEERIEYYGKYQDGIWNAFGFPGLNVNIPTTYAGNELWLVNANDKLHWFTGMTSTNNKDQSLVSGIMVEAASTSKKPVLYVFEMDSITDEAGAVSAMESALGADSMKWNPVLPQPYIVDGKFNWTAVIVSEANNIFQKKAYMSDISNVSFNGNNFNPKVGEDVGLTDKEALMKEILKKIDELSALKKQYSEM
jgi:hypothetical protein